MNRLLLGTAAGMLLSTSPALAQSVGSMPGMHMPGMKMLPKQKLKGAAKAKARAKAKAKAKSGAAAKKAGPAKPRAKATSTKHRSSSGHAGKMHDMSAIPGMSMPPGKTMENMPAMSMPQEQAVPQTMGNMPGMTMPAGQTMPGMNMPGLAMPGSSDMAAAGTNLPAGNAPPPPFPADHAADRTFPPAVMQKSREEFRREQGGENFHQVLFNLAEYQVRDGRNGYRWDGEAWFGGDITRLVVKFEGEGTFREGVESAEVQALYSRAIGPYFNLQAGVRHDFQPSPTRTYTTVGVEGLAPYMFETEAALFLSNKGDLLARASAWYDQRLTQRLILQPRAELNLAAQDVPENRVGAGLVDTELGLRLRYEISRQFAPYVGVSYETKVGRTADYARADGHDVHTTSVVVGLRTWF